MFTEKEVEAYRSIRAPEGLYQKLKRQHNKPKRVFYLAASLAACLVLVVAATMLFHRSSIVVNGQVLKDQVVFYHTAPLAERSASSGVSVPIEYKGRGTAELSVSRGWISREGGSPAKVLEVSSSEIVWWEIEPLEGARFELVLSAKKSVKKLTLEYQEGKITVKKEN